MTNNEIIAALADYNFRLSNETIEECPIKIVSREDINGEDAELVRFTFGYNDDSCVAIVYSDGTYFTPYDWLSCEWDDQEWEIEDTRWNDPRPLEAIIFNGMPRILA